MSGDGWVGGRKRKGKEEKGAMTQAPSEREREGKTWVVSGSGVRDSGAPRMKEKDWKGQSEGGEGSGWRVKGEVGVLRDSIKGTGAAEKSC